MVWGWVGQGRCRETPSARSAAVHPTVKQSPAVIEAKPGRWHEGALHGPPSAPAPPQAGVLSISYSSDYNLLVSAGVELSPLLWVISASTAQRPFTLRYLQPPPTPQTSILAFHISVWPVQRGCSVLSSGSILAYVTYPII